MRKLSVTAALAALLAATPAAAAAPSPRATVRSPGGATMNGDLSPWVLLGYNYGAGTGYGFGVRYQAVVVPQGFLHLQNGVHDELGIEFGADFVHYSWGFFGYNWTYNEISPVIGAAWNFWLTPQLCLYPKLDLAFRFGSWTTPSGYPYGHPGGYGGAGLELAAGVAYRIGDRLALRAEAGTYALRFGLAFTL